jgi:hypothetical protein
MNDTERIDWLEKQQGYALVNFFHKKGRVEGKH